MSEYRKNISMLVNFCLVALLGAAWAASHFPHSATAITCIVAAGSLLVAIIVPMMARPDDCAPDIELSVRNAFDDLSDSSDEIADNDLEDKNPVEWSGILQKWNDPHEQFLQQSSTIRNVIRKAVLEDRQNFGRNVIINIGSVNLITRNHLTSIKMVSAADIDRKHRDKKIDVILTPGEHNELFQY